MLYYRKVRSETRNFLPSPGAEILCHEPISATSSYYARTAVCPLLTRRCAQKIFRNTLPRGGVFSRLPIANPAPDCRSFRPNC